jgi:hypothetical protein
MSDAVADEKDSQRGAEAPTRSDADSILIECERLESILASELDWDDDEGARGSQKRSLFDAPSDDDDDADDDNKPHEVSRIHRGNDMHVAEDKDVQSILHGDETSAAYAVDYDGHVSASGEIQPAHVAKMTLSLMSLRQWNSDSEAAFKQTEGDQTIEEIESKNAKEDE